MISAGGSSVFYLHKQIFTNTNIDINYETYLNHIGLNKNESSYYIASHLSGLIDLTNRSPRTKYTQRNGIVSIDQKTKLNPQFEESYKNFFEKNQEIIRNKTLERLRMPSSLAGQLVFFAVKMASYKTNQNSNTSEHVSIYSLLGSIFDLLFLSDKEFSNVDLILQSRTQINFFGSHVHKIKNEDFSTTLEEEDDSDELQERQTHHEISEKPKETLDITKAWLSNIKIDARKLYSSVLMGKIWTKFYYTISNISSNFSRIRIDDSEIISTNYVLLNQALSLHIIAFLNSVLIEEFNFITNQNSTIDSEIQNLKNIQSSYREFFNNSKILKNHLEKMEIFKTLMTCPFIYPFWKICEKHGDFLFPKSFNLFIEVKKEDFEEISTLRITKKSDSAKAATPTTTPTEETKRTKTSAAKAVKRVAVQKKEVDSTKKSVSNPRKNSHPINVLPTPIKTQPLESRSSLSKEISTAFRIYSNTNKNNYLPLFLEPKINQPKITAIESSDANTNKNSDANTNKNSDANKSD